MEGVKEARKDPPKSAPRQTGAQGGKTTPAPKKSPYSDEQLQPTANAMLGPTPVASDNTRVKPVQQDLYYQKVLESEDYRKFQPTANDSKKDPLEQPDKWDQYFSQGTKQVIQGIDFHFASGSKNTYKALAKKYGVTEEKIRKLNAELIKQNGELIPDGSQLRLSYNKVYPEGSKDTFTADDAICEYAAHYLAYKPFGYTLKEEELQILKNGGYSGKKDVHKWIDGEFGFQALFIKGVTKPDLLAVRGTNPGLKSSDMLTIYADTAPEAVGKRQMTKKNLANIEEKVFAFADGKIDITGHSLGGAVAQLLTAQYPNKIRKVSTFQSPGVDTASVDKINKIPAKQRPEAVHHIVKGDVVDKVGDGNLPGMVASHDFGITPVDMAGLIESGTRLVNSFLIIKKNLEAIGPSLKEIAVPNEITDAIAPFKATETTIETGKIVARLATAKVESIRLKAYLAQFAVLAAKAISSVGPAHGKMILSSKDHADVLQQLGIKEEYMTRPH